MSLAVAVPVAISAVKALVRFRGRVDEILALQEASKPLPFSLPQAPTDFGKHKVALFAYFHSDAGRLVLEVQGRVADFAALKADPSSPATFKTRQELLRLFFEASGTAPLIDGLDSDARNVRASADMRLSYYVVASHRLARNPALTRILLATADTLLEVAGENAGLFLTNPKTQAIVGTLIEEFAGKRDFDDDSGEMLFKSLLRSAVVAAMEHQDSITDEPALVALFGALADMRKEFGDEFVAKILTRDGFQGLVGKYISQVAEDPSFLIEEGPFRAVLAATLKDLGENFGDIFDDPKALFGVLEVALASAAGQARVVLDKKVGGKPLLTAVLDSVLGEIETRGSSDNLLKSVANGEILSGVFQASMSAIASNPDALAKAARIDALSASLVAGLADVLSAKELKDVVSQETLRAVASRSLLVLSENGDALGLDGEFTTKLATGVLKAASSAIADGISKDDLAALLDAAIKTSTANLGLLKLDVRLEGVLEAIGTQLSEAGVKALIAPRTRGPVILAGLEAVARNPKVWTGFAEAALVQPIVAAVFTGLRTDKTAILSGPAMVDGVRQVLAALAKRGQSLIDKEIEPADVQRLLTLGLRKVDQEIGREIDGENLPEYLRRLVEFFFDDPFELDSIASADFKALHELAMNRAEVVEPGGVN